MSEHRLHKRAIMEGIIRIPLWVNHEYLFKFFRKRYVAKAKSHKLWHVSTPFYLAFHVPAAIGGSSLPGSLQTLFSRSVYSLHHTCLAEVMTGWQSQRSTVYSPFPFWTPKNKQTKLNHQNLNWSNWTGFSLWGTLGSPNLPFVLLGAPVWSSVQPFPESHRMSTLSGECLGEFHVPRRQQGESHVVCATLLEPILQKCGPSKDATTHWSEDVLAQKNQTLANITLRD